MNLRKKDRSMQSKTGKKEGKWRESNFEKKRSGDGR